MRILVRPSWLLDDLQLDLPYVVISITDPPPLGKPKWIKSKPGPSGVCRLEFCDVQNDTHPLAMTAKHGLMVWNFLKRMEWVTRIVIHCNSGASRSPSMAMAICDAKGWYRSIIDWNTVKNPAVPNPLVYDRVRSAFPQVVA